MNCHQRFAFLDVHDFRACLCGKCWQCFDQFREMVVKSLFNSVTMMVMLQACYVSKSLIHGSQLHGYAIKCGLCQDICDSMLGTYVNILCNWLILCQNALVIWQIQVVFNTSRNKVSSSSVKAMQVRKCRILNLDNQHLSRFKESCFSPRLDSCSTDIVSVKIYEVQFFKLIFIQSVNVCLGFLFSQSQTYINIILRAIKSYAQFHKCEEV